MASIDARIFHFFLLVLILILFSSLSIDAVLLGSYAIYLFQQRNKERQRD